MRLRSDCILADLRFLIATHALRIAENTLEGWYHLAPTDEEGRAHVATAEAQLTRDERHVAEALSAWRETLARYAWLYDGDHCRMVDWLVEGPNGIEVAFMRLVLALYEQGMIEEKPQGNYFIPALHSHDPLWFHERERTAHQ